MDVYQKVYIMFTNLAPILAVWGGCEAVLSPKKDRPAGDSPGGLFGGCFPGQSASTSSPTVTKRKPRSRRAGITRRRASGVGLL